MKKYFLTLVCIAVLLTVACAVRDHFFDSEPASAVSAEDEYVALHKTVDNSSRDWNLILVNNWNEVPDEIELSLYETENGEKVDVRIYPYLEEMLSDAKEEGHLPEITSGYRTDEKQQELMDEKVSEYRSAGYSGREAKELALQWVAEPGFSEHHTGLAVDINSADGDSWDLYVWLAANCHKYGFILRYPYDKTGITGISYEPWHFRYVGTDAAEYISENGITLEEYVINA